MIQMYYLFSQGAGDWLPTTISGAVISWLASLISAVFESSKSSGSSHGKGGAPSVSSQGRADYYIYDQIESNFPDILSIVLCIYTHRNISMY